MKEAVIKTALISVTDKRDLTQFARILAERGVMILSSSGTLKHLSGEGIEAEDISTYTGSPELLDGRVKTLHPKIHAGILADRSVPAHGDQLEERSIRPIDLVVVNLYPFVEKYRSGKLSEKEMCEFIDIGGITLIRAAAKNFHGVAIVTSPSDYAVVGEEIASTGAISLDTRRRLARDAFALTSSYDTAINEFFLENTPTEGAPGRLNLTLEKIGDLRYGENPHQSAAVYGTSQNSPMVSMTKHQGKELSYNNYLDIIGAFSLARDLGEGSVAIIKHTNPCGAAWCGDVLQSYQRALATDPVSAFGGIVAVNGEINAALAKELKSIFLEVILARSYAEDALALFAKKKNLRVITIPDAHWDSPDKGRLVVVMEGIGLLQDSDVGFPELSEIKVMTKRSPSDGEHRACTMAWKVAKHVKSNAIVIADAEGTIGVGAGQMSRVDSSHIAFRKAKDAGFSLANTVAASDAFFPFADGVVTLAEQGIKAIIEPGGSIRDDEVVEAADEADVILLFTGRRHFRHI